jgi:hypothetical protein
MAPTIGQDIVKHCKLENVFDQQGLGSSTGWIKSRHINLGLGVVVFTPLSAIFQLCHGCQ